MNVLSLFDGISCGMVALERANIHVDSYIAYEIDKFAIRVSQKNYPQIKQMGDVMGADFSVFKNVDLLIGGSPCTHWSIANSNRETTTNGIGYDLFMQYIRARKEVNPTYFFYENNNSIHPNIKKEITQALGVKPILINSARVSPQQRKRLYWTNIPIRLMDLMKSEKKHLTIQDILEPNVDEKYYMNYPIVLNENYQKSALKKIGEIPREHLRDNERQRVVYAPTGKSPTLLARHDTPKILVAGMLDMKATEQIRRVYQPHGKSPTVDTACGGHRQVKVLQNGKVRKLTPLECERLQTLPDNYTDCVSDTQRYKGIGNGWTVEVIAHIFSSLNNCTQLGYN